MALPMAVAPESFCGESTVGASILSCLLVGCLDIDFIGFYGFYDIGAKSSTFRRGPEDS